MSGEGSYLSVIPCLELYVKERSVPRNWYGTHTDARFSAQRRFISLEGKAGGEGVCEGDSSKHKQARKVCLLLSGSFRESGGVSARGNW